jgi:hypothetical protein
MNSSFQKILDAWDDNESSSEIYHMILDFITIYKDKIKHQDLVNDIIKRMEDNDSTNDIVEDVIYGDAYEDLRNEFRSCDKK